MRYNEVKIGDGIYISKGKDAKQFTDDGKVINFPESDTRISSSSNDAAESKSSCCDKIKPSSDSNGSTNEKPLYIYKNTGELIQILECEFIEFQEEICLLKKANEDMLEYDAHDYDLIQAREDNLKIINKRINQLRDLQRKLKEFCPTHPFVLKDVFDIIAIIENNRENPEQGLYQILQSNQNKNSEKNNNSNGNIITEENKNSFESGENRSVRNANNLDFEITGNVTNNSENPSSAALRNERNQENAKKDIILEIDL